MLVPSTQGGDRDPKLLRELSRSDVGGHFFIHCVGSGQEKGISSKLYGLSVDMRFIALCTRMIKK
jgi:hypothetical protein